MFGKISHAKNQAGNTPIQGSAGDIVKKAQVLMFKDKRLQELGFKQKLQVHDEVLAEVPIVHYREASKLMQHHMESSYSDVLSVNLEVDGGVGFTWQDSKG